MNSLLSTWRSMTLGRRAVVVGATLAMFAAVILLARLAASPSPALLYSGLDGNRSGEVLAALDQRGVAYEVRGESIYVDRSQRDQLRMALAGEGLPADDGAGYELLDSLSGFGTTAQMFDAALWRAREGELARTIAASAGIRHARVHIASPAPSGLRSPTRPTASVTVTPRAGGLTAEQARAIRYLVASAVPGLAPQDVAVIDSQSGLLARDDDPARLGDMDRAALLRRNVERLLEARVGPGNAIVEVSVATSDARESVRERRFDPQGRVAIATDSEETSGSSSDGDGAVTVASNLPAGDAAKNGGRASRNSETRERVNYEVSETTRESHREPGAITRLTVAVLVNAIPAAEGAKGPTPRDETELAALRDLVASAVGYSEERGDQITIRSLAFETPAPVGSEPPAGLLASLALDATRLVQAALLALVAIVMILFVLRPILSRPSAPPLSLPPLAAGALTVTGQAERLDDAEAVLPRGTIPRDHALAAIDPVPADPVERLRRLIDERKAETVEILRGWMEDQPTGAER